MSVFYSFCTSFHGSLTCRVFAGLNVSPSEGLGALSGNGGRGIYLVLVVDHGTGLCILSRPVTTISPTTHSCIVSAVVGGCGPSTSIVVSARLVTSVRSVLSRTVFLGGNGVALRGAISSVHRRCNGDISRLFERMFG